jgi:hypothetical protein
LPIDIRLTATPAPAGIPLAAHLAALTALSATART